MTMKDKQATEQSKKLVLVGDSALAEIAYEYFVHDSCYEPVAFAVEREYITKDQLFGLPVVAFEDLEDRGMLTRNDDAIVLTRDGLLQADSLLPTFYSDRYRGGRYT